MLQNPLSWNPNSVEIVYTSASEKGRNIYLYDVYTETSRPIKFPENDWFEFQYIHKEQFIIHVWKKGIYLHDIPTKKSQKLLDAPLSRFFDFNAKRKKMCYNNEQSSFIYDPKTMKSQELIPNTNEIIIDPVHQTFIAISDTHEPELNIFYKNESIVSIANAYNIHVTADYNFLIYFSEDMETEKSICYLYDLSELKIKKEIPILGLVQNANSSDGILHINMLRNNVYSLYNIHMKTLDIKAIRQIEHKDQLFTSLSPDKSSVAILKDIETSTQIGVLELENEL